jgi:acetolactate synthase-1/2/3 large subunit
VISEESVEAAVRMIDEAEKPVLYIGGGVTASGAGKEIVELSEKADIPIVHSLMASDAVSCDYELNLGMLGMHGFIAANRAVDQADLIVALGARFSDRSSPNMSKWGRRARKLQIDVDRSEVDKNIMVDKAVIGDARDFLIRALPRVSSARHPEWHKRVLNWKAKGIVNEVVESTLHPRDIMENISSMTRGDAIFVTDVGQHQMWAAQYLRIGEGNRFITSGGLGAMGYGYGASIGAKLGCPDRQVIHITGDGSFHMNLNEVLTAVEQKLPIITVILNNETLGMVYQLQTTFCESRYSNTIHHRKMDYVKVAEGFGIKGYSVSDVKGFRDAFSKALEEDGPVWIECTISRFEKVLPFIPGGKTVDDMILY